MANQDKINKRLTKEEIEELIKDVAEDPETEEEQSVQPVQLTGNPLYDRWVADDERINKYGL